MGRGLWCLDGMVWGRDGAGWDEHCNACASCAQSSTAPPDAAQEGVSGQHQLLHGGHVAGGGHLVHQHKLDGCMGRAGREEEGRGEGLACGGDEGDKEAPPDRQRVEGSRCRVRARQPPHARPTHQLPTSAHRPAACQHRELLAACVCIETQGAPMRVRKRVTTSCSRLCRCVSSSKSAGHVGEAGTAASRVSSQLASHSTPAGQAAGRAHQPAGVKHRSPAGQPRRLQQASARSGGAQPPPGRRVAVAAGRPCCCAAAPAACPASPSTKMKRPSTKTTSTGRMPSIHDERPKRLTVMNTPTMSSSWRLQRARQDVGA